MHRQQLNRWVFSNARTLALASVSLTVVLIAIIVLGPLWRGNYNIVEDGISQFALGEHGWIGTVYFALSAVLMAAFARSLTLSIPPSKTLKIATWMLYVIGACLVLLVFVKTEPQRGYWPLHRIIHDVISSVGAGLLPLACLLVAFSIKNDKTWRSLAAYSFATAILLALIDAMSITFFLHIHIVGLQQRLLFLVAFSWVVAMSLETLRVSSGKSSLDP